MSDIYGVRTSQPSVLKSATLFIIAGIALREMLSATTIHLPSVRVYRPMFHHSL